MTSDQQSGSLGKRVMAGIGLIFILVCLIAFFWLAIIGHFALAAGILIASLAVPILWEGFGV